MLTPFLKYVSEARIVRRQSDLQRYTFQEITERIYLSFLTLSLLKNFNQTAGFVKTYATQTLSYGNFDQVRGRANDLHNMLAIVAGDPAIVQKLANKNAAMALRQRQSVPVLAIRRYLRDFKNDYSFLSQLETALSVSNSDYKNLRRAISDFMSPDRIVVGLENKSLKNSFKRLYKPFSINHEKSSSPFSTLDTPKNQHR